MSARSQKSTTPLKSKASSCIYDGGGGKLLTSNCSCFSGLATSTAILKIVYFKVQVSTFFEKPNKKTLPLSYIT